MTNFSVTVAGVAAAQTWPTLCRKNRWVAPWCAGYEWPSTAGCRCYFRSELAPQHRCSPRASDHRRLGRSRAGIERPVWSSTHDRQASGTPARLTMHPTATSAFSWQHPQGTRAKLV